MQSTVLEQVALNIIGWFKMSHVSWLHVGPYQMYYNFRIFK